MTRRRDKRIATAMMGSGEHFTIDKDSFHYSRVVPRVKPGVHSEDSDEQDHCENVGHGIKGSPKKDPKISSLLRLLEVHRTLPTQVDAILLEGKCLISY